MTSIAELVPVLQTLLTTTAEQAGRDSGLIRRVRAFTGATFVQTLVFGWLANPDATLDNLAQTAAMRGVPVSAQAIADRFSPQSAACLAQVLAAAIRQTILATPIDRALLDRFVGVVVIDGSAIGLPADLAVHFPGGANQAGTHAALKLGVGIDLVTGRLDGPHLMAARPHDRLLPIQDAPLEPGAIRLADLGFFDLAVSVRSATTGGIGSPGCRAAPSFSIRRENASISSPCCGSDANGPSICRCCSASRSACPHACSLNGCRKRWRRSGGNGCATRGDGGGRR
jgi:hypothetical protein